MRLAHISIKVDDLEAASEFYEKALGFRVVRGGVSRDHYSHHLTDGNVDLALMKYDAGATSKESQVGGDGDRALPRADAVLDRIGGVMGNSKR